MSLELNKIYNLDWIDGLKQLDNESIDVCMTSPPYWGLRDYGVEGQLGLEPHPKEWINRMVEGLAILKKKLKKTGSLWLNVGDTYFGGGTGQTQSNDFAKDKFSSDAFDAKAKGLLIKNSMKPDGKWLQPKQLMLMPSRLAIALQDDGWILRNDIIWQKPNPMPSSVKDRLNTTYEHVFHFVRSRRYYYDLDAIREPHSSGIALLRKEYEERKLGSWHNHEADDSMGQHQGINTPQELHYNPSGKNPGDVIKAEEDIINKDYGILGQNARNRHYINKDGGLSIPHYDTNLMGKNPGDVIAFDKDYRNSDYFQPIQLMSGYMHPNGKNPGDVMAVDAQQDFWQITTQPFPEAHFATYPIKLCEKPIKATLPREICVKCGFIRERILKIDRPEGYKESLKEDSEYSNNIIRSATMSSENVRPLTTIFNMSINTERQTIGWTSCNCNAGFKAGIILDPFAGAGTTFVAMYKYNPLAKFIGFEINPKYIEMANKRLKPQMEQTRLNEVKSYFKS